MSRRIIVSGGSRPRELVLVGTLIVGRDPTCDIHDAADQLLSRRHAEITGAKEVIVRDLGSRNGILVNGVKTQQSVLRGGDVVQIGQLQVKLVDEVGPFLDIPGAGSDLAPTFVPTAASTNASTNAPEGAIAAATVVLNAPTVPHQPTAPDDPTAPHTGVPYDPTATGDLTRKLGS